MSKEKLTTDTLFDYAESQGKQFGTSADALEYFLGDYRGVQSNTGLAVLFANRVANIEDDEERLKLGRLYKAVDEDLEDFAGEQSAIGTTLEYVGKGILDPLNILGFGAGTIVGRTVGKVALNRIISNAFKGNISKEISKDALKKTVGLGAGIGGVEGVGQGLSLEDVKGKDKLGIQDEMNLGNIALMGGLGAVTGGAFGALGGRKAAKELTRAGEIIQKKAEAVENTVQGQIARSSTVQNFVNSQGDKITPETLIGTYVKPTDVDKKLLDDAENYGEFGLITDIIDGRAEIEFLPTNFGQKLNPQTGKFDERKAVSSTLDEIKAVSEKDKRNYQEEFVKNYGLFFSKADIEKGKELLRTDSSIVPTEIDTIFEVGLREEDFINATNVVFDVAKSFMDNPNINPRASAKIRVVLDDPTKRISEKFAELFELSADNKELLDNRIAENLIRYNLSEKQFANIFAADVSIGAAKVGEMGTQARKLAINKLVDANTKIGGKLSRMSASLTDSQRKILSDIAEQREAERKMAQKFGIFVDIWRSFLVTQPATTFRNIFGSALRVPGETLDISLQSANFIRKFEANALGIDVPEVNLSNERLLLAKNLLNPMEQIELASIVGKEFPEAQRKIFDVFDDYFATTLGEDSKAGGFLRKLSFASKYANVANRAQDRAIKSAGFMTELDNQIKTAIRRGEIVDPEVKGIEDVISEMVSKSLQFAYKLTYQSRNAGDDVIGVGGLINAAQRGLNRLAIAKLGVPFPNFLLNGFAYTLNRGLGFGIAKAIYKRIQIGKAGTEKAVELAKEERSRIKELSEKIDATVRTGTRDTDKKDELVQMQKELQSLQAKAGGRLRDVEQYRKGIVESVEGFALIGVGYGLRELYGGARYDELKVGNTTVDVGPLFPLTPFLFIGEFIRKLLNNEPITARLIGEGAEAITGLQTDRAGPVAKFLGGIQKFLSEIDSDDPLAAKKTGELVGGMIGYIVKGFVTPLKAPDDFVKTVGPKEFRQAYEKGFQEFITKEGDTYSKEMVRGVFNEFVRQMVRGTSLQGAVFGERSVERPLQSVTGLQPDAPELPFGKQLSGVSPRFPRGDVGDELERVGIRSYTLEVRSEVPEYTFEFKQRLGKLAEKHVKPMIETDFYKSLSIQDQEKVLNNAYKGRYSSLPEPLRRSFRDLGYRFNNIRQVAAEQIKTEKPLLYNLHNFRKRNTKKEIRDLYKRRKDAGRPIPQLKYLGEKTTARGYNDPALDQDSRIQEYQNDINRERARLNVLGGLTQEGRAIGQKEGGYIGQNFNKGGVVSKKNLNFLKNFLNTVLEEGRERLEGDDTGPQSVTTVRIVGLNVEGKEYLLPSYDPYTKKIMSDKEVVSKFLPAILDGQIEGYKSVQKAEEDRKKIYKDIIGR